jgi:uncharacterized Ntn-hydrolase superfamily protein
MTFSLLARDHQTGALGGVAATGNLCVGGWVLRGDARGGITASQGRTPSTLWGEDALAALVAGVAVSEVAQRIPATDGGAGHRQLVLMDVEGTAAVFSGAENHPYTGHRDGTGWVAAGNWLTGPEVIEAASNAFAVSEGELPVRLLSALDAGIAAGSDRRGTLSAALLVVARDRPPLTLRVDHDEAPVARLWALYEKTREPAYQEWLATVPTRDEPERT